MHCLQAEGRDRLVVFFLRASCSGLLLHDDPYLCIYYKKGKRGIEGKRYYMKGDRCTLDTGVSISQVCS